MEGNQQLYFRLTREQAQHQQATMQGGSQGTSFTTKISSEAEQLASVAFLSQGSSQQQY